MGIVIDKGFEVKKQNFLDDCHFFSKTTLIAI